MKSSNLKYLMIIGLCSAFITSCTKDDDDDTLDFSGTYMQADQMGRPAINTVFINSGSKDAFNTTVPSQQGATYASMIQTNLTALSPAYANPGDQNALGLDAAAFSGVLATDVLSVATSGITSFYNGTEVLTGRALGDDVITVELLLIFGGEDFTENPSLSDDHVDTNDKQFLSSFPYLASPW